jgi:hypothetical protein
MTRRLPPTTEPGAEWWQLTIDGQEVRFDKANCPTCQRTKPGEMAPRHDASPRCESGRRPHCTCDTCF